MWIHPATGFDSGNLQAGASERENGHAAGRAQPDYRDIDWFPIDGHGIETITGGSFSDNVDSPLDNIG